MDYWFRLFSFTSWFDLEGGEKGREDKCEGIVAGARLAWECVLYVGGGEIEKEKDEIGQEIQAKSGVSWGDSI